MAELSLLITDLNPTPWQSPDLSVGRASGGRVYPQAHTPASQRAYQSAISEAFEDAYPSWGPLFKAKQPLSVFFFYWRKLDTYKTRTGRSQTAKRIDVTNTNKATEDALQGLLYYNDVDNTLVLGRMVEQSADADPAVLVYVTDNPIVRVDLLVPAWGPNERARLEMQVQPPNPPGNVRLEFTP